MRKSLTVASQPRGRLARTAVAFSARLNYERALRWPGQPPYIVLTEFPRSGGNWVRDMLGDALQLPVPRFGRFPVTFPAIIHNHDHRVLVDHPSVYVLRDGRDVFLSHMDKTITAFERGTRAVKMRILKLHPSLGSLKKGINREAVDMMAFYQEWKMRPLGSKVDWGTHLQPWLAARPKRAAFIRYEDMRSAPAETLKKALDTFLSPEEEVVSQETINFAVRRNSFEAQTGRKPGVKDVTSTKRMGLAGAWKHQMPEDIKTAFRDDFGETLEAAGYEI